MRTRVIELPVAIGNTTEMEMAVGTSAKNGNTRIPRTAIWTSVRRVP
jgi:hypothetical protein